MTWTRGSETGTITGPLNFQFGNDFDLDSVQIGGMTVTGISVRPMKPKKKLKTVKKVSECSIKNEKLMENIVRKEPICLKNVEGRTYSVTSKKSIHAEASHVKKLKATHDLEMKGGTAGDVTSLRGGCVLSDKAEVETINAKKDISIIDSECSCSATSRKGSITAKNSTLSSIKAAKNIELTCTNVEELTCKWKLIAKAPKYAKEMYTINEIDVRSKANLTNIINDTLKSSRSVKVKNCKLRAGECVDQIQLQNSVISEIWTLILKGDTGKITMDASSTIAQVQVFYDGPLTMNISKMKFEKRAGKSSGKMTMTYSIPGKKFNTSKPLPKKYASIFEDYDILKINGVKWQKDSDGEFRVKSKMEKEKTLEEIAKIVVPKIRSMCSGGYGNTITKGYKGGSFTLKDDTFSCTKLPPGMTIVPSKEEAEKTVELIVSGGTIENIEFLNRVGCVKLTSDAKILSDVVHGEVIP